MKVLMIARSTLNSSPGGDTVQIESTAKYLRDLGVHVDIFIGENTIAYSDYDLLHFFNIIRPDDIIPHLSKSGLPFVISTIYVDYTEYEQSKQDLRGWLARFVSSDKMEYLKAIGRYLKNGETIKSSIYLLKGHKGSIKYIAEKAALLLPNSHNEYNRFVARYNVSAPYRKVVNAIDTEIFNRQITPDKRFKDHVLCVARIEGRKNQLNLIKALVGTDVKLTIIGKASPNHKAYYNECLELINQNNNMRLIDHLEQHELASIFKSAKVHVLPSWFETTGLSSLEAAFMGCNIVVTEKGDTVEYFGDLAYYCDPDNVSSIRTAVLDAYNKPFKPAIEELILSKYRWENAASQTYDAYNVVLN
jgi:glycosyltransferase involved in cell wall biosynthesis